MRRAAGDLSPRPPFCRTPFVPACPCLARPGEASRARPIVGECYDLTDEQAGDDYWADTGAGAVHGAAHLRGHRDGAGPDGRQRRSSSPRIAAASLTCGPRSASTPPMAGIIEDPIRIEARSFVAAARTSTCAARSRCGTDGPAPATLVHLDAPRSTACARRTTRALRHCSSAEDGRRALAPPITVRCSSRPRWQVTAWILWSALYDDYPGSCRAQERAAELCGPRTVRSLPTAPRGRTESPRTWCYRKVP